MKFSIIICGYNEEENLKPCIESCINQKYNKKNYEIIYVDNNSKDNSVKIAKKYPIKVLKEKKQGLSEARNCGIKNSKGEILIFFDADAKMEINYLINHEKTFKNKKIAAGGGKVLPWIETIISNYLGVSLFEGYPRDINDKYMRTYPGCNLTIRKSIIDEVGMFKEGLKTSKGITRFAEDREICERILKATYKIRYNSKAIIYHKNTFKFLKLVNIWIKGAKGRVAMIRLGKKDPFTILFEFNIPLIAFLIFLLTLFIDIKLSFVLFLLGFMFFMALSINKYINTKMFFQSFIVKPILDFISLIIINCSVIYYRFKK